MLDSRKTKIIATLGPASNSVEVIGELIAAGVNVFRLNFSHGTRAFHRQTIDNVRHASGKLNLPVAILLDLQGPRIRVGELEGGSTELKPGEKIVLSAEVEKGHGSVISITYKDLYRDVELGDRILMDDGLFEVKVEAVKGTGVECRVIYGGVLKEHKGLNLPGINISAPSLSEKDLEDIDFGVANGVDYIALSFVRKASDVFGVKERLKGADISVIAKIEKAEALENLEGILDEADGIMIARGDLGVELSAEDIPVLQKRLIHMANEAGKIVITATQMLESMISNPRPTRAEASDVANAVFDGTDALMLSGETAVGKYPVKAVETMSKIAKEAEEATLAQTQHLRRKKPSQGPFSQAVAAAAAAAAPEVNSRAIVLFTQSGETARIMAKLRPLSPVVAFTSQESTWRKLALIWGVQPFMIEFGEHTDEMICRGEAALLDYGLAEWGDTIVILSGTKVGMRGATNMMKIDWIGSEECKLYIKKKAE